MAISMMDDIYRRSKRIIAVPDLCYCTEYPLMENITNEDIERAIKAIWDYEVDSEKKFCASVRLMNEFQCIYPLKATKFIPKIMQEWACRSWVISERTIGVKNKKLDIIILRANGTKIPYWHWNSCLPIDWNITFDQRTLIKTIVNSKSTKYADRLFAILPHTQYKDAMHKLVDNSKCIDSIVDLKMALMDILDTEGQMILLNDMLFQDGGFPHVSPSFMEDERFGSSMSDNLGTKYYSEIGTTEHNGKRALKISGPYILRLRAEIESKSARRLSSNISSAIDIVLFKDVHGLYKILRCLKLNDVWLLDNFSYETDITCDVYKHGVFVFFE